MVYLIYIVLNSASLHFFGVQFRFPFNRSNIESVQTRRGMERCLRATGFQDIEFSAGDYFVVSARRAAIG
jgi:hypothetical protein